MAAKGALDGLRVLDFSGAPGNYCGKLFADLGADVILVEPPRGSDLRHEGPYIDGNSGIEASLAFAYSNTSKRGITLDLDHPRGQAIARNLMERADIVLETEKPGVMARRGLSWSDVSSSRPSLVYTSITLAGQTGPWSKLEGGDLIAMALGGMLSLAGYFDGEPIVAYGHQAYAAGSLFGAVATMMATLESERSGVGEYIDVSIHEAVVMGMENAPQFYDLEGTVRRRYAGDQRQAGSGVFACRDGHVYMLAGGVGANKFWRAFTHWMESAGVTDAADFHDPRWLEPAYLKSADAKALFLARFSAYAAGLTKAQLQAAAQEHRVPLAPVATPAEILSQEQLRHRGYFVQVWNEHAGRSLTMPGAPYRLLGTPWRIARPAPRLGEHNREVLCEVGINESELARLAAEGVVA